jgi:hypothetical protein
MCVLACLHRHRSIRTHGRYTPWPYGNQTFRQNHRSLFSLPLSLWSGFLISKEILRRLGLIEDACVIWLICIIKGAVAQKGDICLGHMGGNHSFSKNIAPPLQARLENFTKRNLDILILKSHKSSRPPLFLRRTVETQFGLLRPVPQQASKRALTKRKLAFSTLHWHLQALSMVYPKQRANTSLILHQRHAQCIWMPTPRGAVVRAGSSTSTPPMLTFRLLLSTKRATPSTGFFCNYFCTSASRSSTAFAPYLESLMTRLLSLL